MSHCNIFVFSIIKRDRVSILHLLEVSLTFRHFDEMAPPVSEMSLVYALHICTVSPTLFITPSE
jgi:hypothetical protein